MIISERFNNLSSGRWATLTHHKPEYCPWSFSVPSAGLGLSLWHHFLSHVEASVGNCTTMTSCNGSNMWGEELYPTNNRCWTLQQERSRFPPVGSASAQRLNHQARRATQNKTTHFQLVYKQTSHRRSRTGLCFSSKVRLNPVIASYFSKSWCNNSVWLCKLFHPAWGPFTHLVSIIRPSHTLLHRSHVSLPVPPLSDTPHQRAVSLAPPPALALAPAEGSSVASSD